MENDVVQICQPCFEMVQNFGIMEWVGVGILGVIALIGFFTKKNLFTVAGGTWNFAKTVGGFFIKKKDTDAIK